MYFKKSNEYNKKIIELTDTLVALLAEAPEELLAESAERRLPEELGHESMTAHLVDSANTTTNVTYSFINN